MALDFFTSWDAFNDLTESTVGPTPVLAVGSSSSVTSGSARHGARGLQSDDFGYAYTPTLAQGNAATRIVGFAYKGGALSGYNGFPVIGFSDGVPTTAGNVQVCLTFTTGGAITAYRGRAFGANTGGTSLGTSASSPILNATWMYIEMLATIHGSTGVVTVWVNGTQVLNLTGQNTSATGNAYANVLAFGGDTANYFDDVYCITNSGSAPNARTGDSHMRSMRPSTGNGTHTDFTPSTGTDHGALVDESPPNTTDYNSCATPGDEDSYNYATLGSVGTIQALNIVSFTQKTDAGTCDARNLTRISSTDYYGTTRGISETWSHIIDAFTVSPATSSAWTESEINGAEFGMERVN